MKSKIVLNILCSLAFSLFYIQAQGCTYKDFGVRGMVIDCDAPSSHNSSKSINLSLSKKSSFYEPNLRDVDSTNSKVLNPIVEQSFNALNVANSSLPSIVTREPALNLTSVKWHPGHYILLYPKQKEPNYFYSVMTDLRANPIFRGVQKPYSWNKLEPQFGVYDFSEVRNDLTNLARINKQLVMTLQAESFITSEKLVPSYLLSEEYEGGVYSINTGKGFNVAYYNKKVQDRLIALVDALGKEFNSHPNLEAVNFEETAPSRTDLDWHRAYTKKYIEGKLRVAVAAKSAFPNTVVIQYVNYPESSLPLIVKTLAASGVGMGGPDVYQNNKYLAQGVYSYYTKISGIIPIGMAVDYHNYQSSVGGSGPLDKPSIESIHKFAVGKLKPNYMFWLRRTKWPLTDFDYWQGVLDYLKRFDWQSDSSGGLNAVCPSAIAQCIVN